MTASNWRRPRCWGIRITNMPATVRRAPATRGTPNRSCGAMATPDDLREICHDDDDFRLEPQKQGDPAGKALAALLREDPSGGNAEIGRQVLHEHGGHI